MENKKEIDEVCKSSKENPTQETQTQNLVVDADAGTGSPAPLQPTRRPFTGLSQVDSDIVLARTLQEQERAYLRLRMARERGTNQSLFNNDEEEDGEEEEDDDDGEEIEEEDGHAGDEDMYDVDPSAFENDEAYARALQQAEERAMAAQMMTFRGLHQWEADDDRSATTETGNNSQYAEQEIDPDEMSYEELLALGERERERAFLHYAEQEIDPDEMSYEELLALGEIVGNESKGLTADMIASLPSSNYNPMVSHNGTSEQCVICRFEYEEGDRLVFLPCKHAYHSECINNWLLINKVCPVCNAEV